jgi:hypothetical protein
MPIYRWVRMLLPIVPLVCSGSHEREAIALSRQDFGVVKNAAQYFGRVRVSVHPSDLPLNGGALHHGGDGYGLHYDDGLGGYVP